MESKMLPTIDADLCDGCGLCVSACPTGALAMDKGKAIMARPELCRYDGECEIVCSRNAISVPFAIVFGAPARPAS